MKYIIYSCALFLAVGNSMYAANAGAAASAADAAAKKDTASKWEKATYSNCCIALSNGSKEISTKIEVTDKEYSDKEYESTIVPTVIAQAQNLLATNSLSFQPNGVTVRFYMHTPGAHVPVSYAHGYFIGEKEDFSRARAVFLQRGAAPSDGGTLVASLSASSAK
jgi:hypothetical protein